MKSSLAAFLPCAALAALFVREIRAAVPAALTTEPGSSLFCGEDVRNFRLTARVKSAPGAEARLAFHTDAAPKGYQALFRNGRPDGTRKTGSLAHVRNRYRSMAEDGTWLDFYLAVRERTSGFRR